MQSFFNPPLHLLQEHFNKINKNDLKSCEMHLTGTKINISLDLKEETNKQKFFKLFEKDYDAYLEKKIRKYFEISLKKEDFGLMKEKKNLSSEENIDKKGVLLRSNEKWRKLSRKFNDNQDFLIEKTFGIIKAEEIDRKITLEEFQTIKNLAKFSDNTTFRNNDVLLVFYEKNQKMFIFSLKEHKKQLKKWKKNIETHYFMNFNGLIMENDKFVNLYEQKKRDIFSDFFCYKCQSSGISLKSSDSQLIICERANKSSVQEKMEATLTTFQQSILVQMLLDVKKDTADAWVEKIIEENENIYVSSDQKHSLLELKDDCVSLSFFGEMDKLYNYFGKKPKHLFLTESFYLALESTEANKKIVQKLLYNDYLLNDDIKNLEDSYFIDLSNKRSDVRFRTLMTFLKQKNLKRESCITTPTKKELHEDFGSSEKHYKEQQSLKSFRGYESEKRENGTCKKLFTTSSEEEEKAEKTTVNESNSQLSEKSGTTSYQNVQEKDSFQGTNKEKIKEKEFENKPITMKKTHIRKINDDRKKESKVELSPLAQEGQTKIYKMGPSQKFKEA